MGRRGHATKYAPPQPHTKDRPILAAAIAERADFLITGDRRDFET
jgi:predicted nucleic acid-binding protein